MINNDQNITLLAQNSVLLTLKHPPKASISIITMNKLLTFICGVVAGCGTTLYVTNALYEQPVDSEPQSKTQPDMLDTFIPERDHRCSYTLPLTEQSRSSTKNSLDDDLINDVFLMNTEHLFESEKFKDLVYLLRKDKNIAAQLRNKFLTTTSYEERYALVKLLAHDNSDETVDLVIDLISDASNESKQLGLDLLRSMDIKESHTGLNRALLDATYYESNPELLTEVIFRLSGSDIDESTKNIAVERFQFLLASDNNTIKASAINGISQLANQSTISSTIKQHIHDTDENIKVSAISAAFQLNATHFDNEMVSALTRIANNSQEPENVRDLASAVLSAQKSSGNY